MYTVQGLFKIHIMKIEEIAYRLYAVHTFFILLNLNNYSTLYINVYIIRFVKTIISKSF